MNPRSLLAALIILVFVAVGLSMAGTSEAQMGSETYTLTISVVDGSDAPVGGAIVSLHRAPAPYREEVTGPTGTVVFIFTADPGEAFWIEVDKAGTEKEAAWTAGSSPNSVSIAIGVPNASAPGFLASGVIMAFVAVLSIAMYLRRK